MNLAEEHTAVLKALRPEETVYSWGLRFLQTVPGVTMVLSGLSSAAQTEENTRTFSEHRPLNEEEWDALQTIAEGMIRKKILPCTGCRYCVEGCPAGIDIPEVFAAVNDHRQKVEGAAQRYAAMPVKADACIGCGKCEKVCPQGLHIPELLKEVPKAF